MNFESPGERPEPGFRSGLSLAALTTRVAGGVPGTSRNAAGNEVSRTSVTKLYEIRKPGFLVFL